MNKSLLIAALIGTAFFFSCNKTEVYPTWPLSDYNLQTPGKYITYQLDSLLFTNFGTQQTYVYYYAKDSVDTVMVTDNLGNPAYRIFHYISQSPTGPWQPNNTYLTIPLGSSVQFVQDNMRFIKLHEPIVNGYNWKGNAYLDTYQQTTAIPGIADFDLTYLDDWDYTYSNVNQPLTLGNITIDSTITVTEQNNTPGVGPVTGDTSSADAFSQISFAVEQYGKGIGLVYRNFLYKQYQPPTPTTGGYYIGYGVTMTMIDHN